jgi:hypothetical protein
MTSTEARTAAVIEAVWPKVQAYGLPVGYGLWRWVSIPYDILVRSQGAAHRIDIRFGRLVLQAEWTDGQQLRVLYFCPGGWDRLLLDAAA